MAKKKARLDDPFAATAPQRRQQRDSGEIEIPADGRTVPTSCGLKESEVEMLDDIATEYGIARNAVMRWALRYFLKEHVNGRLSLYDDVESPPPPRNRLNMP